MDWDDESVEPPAAASSSIFSGIVNKWDGEDEDDSVKHNWEDDDDDKRKNEQKKQSAQSKKPKSRRNEKIEKREGKETERGLKRKAQVLNKEIDITNMTPEQIQAEKLRRQKLQEESDFEVAKEMSGPTDEDSIVVKMNPKTEEEFKTFRDALCKKISMYKRSDYFSTFIKELFRDLSATLSWTDLRNIKFNVMDKIFYEKARVEKLAKRKKSKAKEKPKLHVEDQNDKACHHFSAHTTDDHHDDSTE